MRYSIYFSDIFNTSISINFSKGYLYRVFVKLTLEKLRDFFLVK
jgi:hypothetical protein